MPRPATSGSSSDAAASTSSDASRRCARSITAAGPSSSSIAWSIPAGRPRAARRRTVITRPISSGSPFNRGDFMSLTGFQQFCLVTLRTAIGWHFAYEGFYKLMLPGWNRAGERVAAWSAAGYLKGATGPFADTFHHLAANPSMVHTVDLVVPIGLLVVGLSLMLGLFTQIGCAGAMLFLATFYLS